jgi:hypothetical protein
MSENVTPQKGAQGPPRPSPASGEDLFVVVREFKHFFSAVPEPMKLVVVKSYKVAQHVLKLKKDFLIRYRPPLYEYQNNDIPGFIEIPYEAIYGIVFLIDWPASLRKPDGIMPYNDFRKNFQTLISKIRLYPYRDSLTINYDFNNLLPEHIDEYINNVRACINEAKNIEAQKVFAGFITPEWKYYSFLKGIVVKNGQQLDDHVWYYKTKKGGRIFFHEPSKYWVIIGRDASPELFAKKLITILRNNKIQDARTSFEERLHALKKILLRMAQIEETRKHAFAATKRVAVRKHIEGDLE